MKVAIVYDRVNKFGGAERILLALNELFPKAPLYTSVYDRGRSNWVKVFPKVVPTIINKIPLLRNKHQIMGTIMPILFETHNFGEYDLVVSVSSEAAKGIITTPKTLHINICLTPTRYLWSGYDEYFDNTLLKYLSYPAIKYLRYWDQVAANRPDKIISISKEVQKRVKKFYKRDSVVIYPPVDTKMFESKKNISKNYYLVVSRLVPYKKVDIAIDAFNKLDKQLLIVGEGSQKKKLKSLAKGNIVFKGFVGEKELISLYQNAKALIFPQIEDFGISAVEAQASGTPVIAFNKGGALETVRDGVTGIFFKSQSSQGIVDAIDRFDRMKFSKETLSENANKFSKEVFKKELKKLINEK